MAEGGVGHDLVVSGQHLAVLVSELLDEGGGRSQVAEHESQGAPGQRVGVWFGLGEPLGHHTRQILDENLGELAW